MRAQMMDSVKDASQQDRRVYIGNLAYDVKWHHLKDFMRQGAFLLDVIHTRPANARLEFPVDGVRWFRHFWMLTAQSRSWRGPLRERTSITKRDVKGGLDTGMVFSHAIQCVGQLSMLDGAVD